MHGDISKQSANIFPRDELSLFANFLDHEATTYFVLIIEDRATACGGWSIYEDTVTAGLAWGMVRAEHHGHRHGTRLLAWRLGRIAQDPAIRRVVMDSSQHTIGFFEKFGFRVTTQQLDGYGPGLHRYDMVLELDEQTRPNLQSVTEA
ncbi:MAG: GNAT family N-acetyltransferase [Alphaproteobacteria bacterium]|nr:GNAT family N-acetyltransferase [Alphaproteobacteria bacterium]